MDYKLGIIVPYRDRESHITKFIPHMNEFFKNKNIEYDIIVVEQEDSLPFNYGKLCNIGFERFKNQYDYFCFHDADLLPVSDDCDYSYKQQPTSLATHVDIRNDLLPYPQYFGGVIILTKEDFESANGYSNEYWGWGLEDLDLLYRLHKSGAELSRYYDCGNITQQAEYDFSRLRVVKRQYKETLPYIDLNGEEWLVLENSSMVAESLDFSFTLSCWVNPDGKFKNDEPGAIVSRPGHDTKITYSTNNTFIAEMWSDDREHYRLESSKKDSGKWYNVVFVFDDANNTATLYVNGIPEDSILLKGIPIKYDTAVPFFIGATSADLRKKKIQREAYIGKVSYVTAWNQALQYDDVFRLFKGGTVDASKNWIHSLPIFHITPRGGFNKFLMDTAQFKHHAKYYTEQGRRELKVKTQDFEKCTNIQLPHRIAGKYNAIRHENDENIHERFYSHDPDIRENLSIYFNEVRTGELNPATIGLNNLHYKIFEHDSGYDNTKWIKVKL